MQARHDRERYDRQHDDLDPTTTAGDDDMEGAYAGGNIIGEGVRVGRHGESILGSGGSGGDLGAADTDINAGNPMISRTSEYVHAVMSSSSRPLGESQGAGAGTSSSMFSSNANANANAIREETLNRSLGDFTTGGGNVSGGGMYHHTGAIETTTRRRTSSVDRQPTHPSDRGVSESLLGPTGDIHPSSLLIYCAYTNSSLLIYCDLIATDYHPTIATAPLWCFVNSTICLPTLSLLLSKPRFLFLPNDVFLCVLLARHLLFLQP